MFSLSKYSIDSAFPNILLVDVGTIDEIIAITKRFLNGGFEVVTNFHDRRNNSRLSMKATKTAYSVISVRIHIYLSNEAKVSIGVYHHN